MRLETLFLGHLSNFLNYLIWEGCMNTEEMQKMDPNTQKHIFHHFIMWSACVYKEKG